MSSNTVSVHYIIIIALVVFFFGFLLYVLSGFFTPLVLGAAFAALSYKWYDWLVGKFKGRKGLAGIIIVIILAILILGPISSLLTVLSKEAFHIFTIARDQVLATDVNAFLQSGHPIARFVDSTSQRLHIDIVQVIQDQALPAVKNIGLSLSNQIGGIFSDVVQLVVGFFIMMMTVYYLLKDGPVLGDFLIRLSPLKTKEEMYMYHTFKEVARAVFFGNFVSALAQGLLGGLGFWMFGISAPVLWGVIMMIMAFIPMFGTAIIFIPAALYLFITGDVWPAIGFLAYNMIIVSSVDNVIKPMVIGDKIKVHPLIIFLAILGGINVFGIMGIVYGPLIVAVFLALLDIYFVAQKEQINKGRL